jgi:NAD(P)-dependent dehydrogenase (short-subunit alcohol dehydrogenase family)
MSEEDYRAQINTNYLGVVHVTSAALPILRRQHSAPHPDLVRRWSGRRVAGMGAYQSAKFAAAGFSEVLNADVKPLGIKVTMT